MLKIILQFVKPTISLRMEIIQYSHSIFGAKNLMIGIVYLVVGSLLLVLATAFAFIAKKDM